MLLQFVSCLVGNFQATKLWWLDLLLIYIFLFWSYKHPRNINEVLFNLHAVTAWINSSAAQILPRPLPTLMGLERISESRVLDIFNFHAITAWINSSAAQILPRPLPTSMGLEIISELTVLDNEIVALSRYVMSLRSLKLA